MRLMLVEDQGLIMGALASLLSMEADITVVAQVASVAEAKASWPLTIDLVLADIELGDGTALDLALWFATQPSPPKIVLLSTFARPGYLLRAQEMGLAGYLLKDMPADELAQSLRRVMQGQSVFASSVQQMPRQCNPLSEREQQVLRLAEQGLTTQQIASSIHRSHGWVRNCLSAAIQKMHGQNRIEAALRARDQGFL